MHTSLKVLLLVPVLLFSFHLKAQDETSGIHKIVEQSMGQARENISNILKEYAQAKDSTSKFLLSSLIVELTRSGTFRDYPSIGQQISDQDKKAIAGIVKEHEKMLEQVRQFESSLAKEDVEKITHGYEQSIFRKIGRYSSLWELGECPTDKYKAARSTLDANGKYQNYPDVSALITLYDGLHVGEYHKRARDLLRSDKRFSKFKSLMDTYYFDLEKSGQNPDDLMAEIKQNIEGMEKKFKENKANKKIVDVKAYVLEVTSNHPECLAGFNKDFWRTWKADLTLERGMHWFEKLKKAKKFECSNGVQLMSTMPLDKSSMVTSSHADAEGFKYYFVAKDNNCSMYAMGEDPKETNDDVLIGAF